MAPILRRWWPAFLAGTVIVILVKNLNHQPSVGIRPSETVVLVLVFLLACVLLDRIVAYRISQIGILASEKLEASRLRELRIGVPEGLVHLEALRHQGRLQQRLQPLGMSVVWREYSSASALLQALNRREIEFCGGGGTPSIFAQAADLMFVRVARDKYTHAGGEAILVQDASSIQFIVDLRGCKVAVEEGSTAHFVLVRALTDAGIDPGDLEIAYLSRLQALPKFRSGAVDAWSVWVPYAESPRRKDYPGRSIASLQNLLGNEPSLKLPTLYYTTPEFLQDYPEILKIVLEEINEAGAQVNRENLAALERLKDRVGVSTDWMEGLRDQAAERTVVPLDGRSLAGLQHQADLLRDLRVIPKRVRVADGRYSVVMRQNWTR